MTHSNVLLSWFAAVVLLVAVGLALGVALTAGMAALMLVICLVPPAIVMWLWPGVQPQTASDVLYGRDKTR